MIVGSVDIKKQPGHQNLQIDNHDKPEILWKAGLLCWVDNGGVDALFHRALAICQSRSPDRPGDEVFIEGQGPACT